jgi:hypothetical protein
MSIIRIRCHRFISVTDPRLSPDRRSKQFHDEDIRTQRKWDNIPNPIFDRQTGSSYVSGCNPGPCSEVDSIRSRDAGSGTWCTHRFDIVRQVRTFGYRDCIPDVTSPVEQQKLPLDDRCHRIVLSRDRSI